MDKLWINPLVVGAVSLLGFAASPLRGLRTEIAAERIRRQSEMARQARERAAAAWSFDESRQTWIPDSLRR